MNQWFDEIRIGLRNLLKAPGFTLVAVCTLALGIGVNTSVFSLANALLLRPLPVEEPRSLRWLTWSGNLKDVQGRGWWANGPHGTTSSSFPYPTFDEFRAELAGNVDVMGLHRISDTTVRAGRQVLLVDGYLVSGNFFEGLGLTASLGRTFGDREDSIGADPVVVLSHSLWQQAFSGDRDVVGKSMSIEGRSFSIIGVLPVGFRGPVKAYDGGYYLPFSALPQIKDWPRLGDAGSWWMEVMLRLDKRAEEAQVKALLQACLTRNTESKYLEDSAVPLRLGMHDGWSGLKFSSEPLDAPLRPLLGAVGMILLISCANLAGLMIARGAGRQHQAAIEGALGASRWCLLRRPMIECGLIGIAGAVLSLIVAAWGKVAVAHWLWPSDIPIDFRYDGRVMLFTFLVALGTVLLFGLLPAWWCSRVDPGTSLRSRSSLGLPRFRWGPALVSIQIGLSLVLLVGGGLFAQSFYRLSKVELGFETGSLLSFRVSAAGAGVDGAQRLPFYQGIQDEVERLPGVAGVALASNQLINDSANTTQAVVRSSGQNEGRELDMLFMHIDESFLNAMRLNLLQGRDFNSSDTKAGEKVMIINQQLAETAFPADNPVGQFLHIDESAFRVIGVCANFKYENLKTEKSISLLPYRQYPDQNERMVFYVRTVDSMVDVAGRIQSKLAALSPDLPPPVIKSMDAQIRASMGSDRASAIVSGGLALLALVLCCIGLYGLMTYNVARRTGELGLRMALGSTRLGIAWRVLGEAGFLSLVGIIGGCLVSIWVNPFLEGRLFRIGPLQPTMLAGAALILLLVALFSAWSPARLASRIDPLDALRSD